MTINNGRVSPGEAPYLLKLLYEIVLRFIFNFIQSSFSFDMSSDVSSDYFVNSHIDARLRFPSVVTGACDLTFHSLVITINESSHTRDYLFKFISDIFDALCLMCENFLIVSMVYRAPNMTGCHSDILKRLHNAVTFVSSDDFY